MNNFTRQFFPESACSKLSKTAEKVLTLQTEQKINSDFNLVDLKWPTTLDAINVVIRLAIDPHEVPHT